jgi:hypothetical protein
VVALRLLNATGQPLATYPTSASATGASTYEAEMAFSAFPPADYVIEISAQVNQDEVKEYLAIRITG